MKEIEHARLMLESAGRDLKAIGGMGDSGVFDDSIFGFHVQQAVEKALKAWLAFLNVEYPKTHDIRLLLSLLDKQGIDTDPLFNFVEYNAFAVQFRYETFSEGDDSIDRKTALSSVDNLIEQISRLIAGH